MAEDPLRDIIDSVRTRLQAELETQLGAVADRHQQALAAERQRIEAEVEQRWTAQLQSTRAEADAQLAAAVAAARTDMDRKAADEAARLRADAERQLAAETARLRAEAEQKAVDAAARVRRELEQALSTERQLAQSRLDAERRTAAEQLEHARELFESERRQWTAPGAPAVSPAAPALAAESLVGRLCDIDAAATVSDSLAAIARAAAAEAPRAALFIANGSQLDEWAVSGLASLSAGSLNINDPDAGLVVEALTTRRAVRHNGTACAVPLLLGGTPIGVLYGERGEADTDGGGAAAWTDSLEAVARFGAAHLGYLTAMRTAQARQWLAASPPTADTDTLASNSEDAVTSARRYARLVVSEIKLYNEPAVQAGRSRRDLRERLAPEIERARRLYEERVPASLAGRGDYFQQELVQTLAGGDPSLLG